MISKERVRELVHLRLPFPWNGLTKEDLWTLSEILIEEINEQLRYLRTRIDNPPPEDK